VPWGLSGLVIYFLFKCSIEWAQCQPNRRQMGFARADFISAWIVAFRDSSYVVQAITRVQSANLLQDPEKGPPAEIGFAVGSGLGMFAVCAFGVLYRPHRFAVPLLFGAVLAWYVSVFILLGVTLRRPFNWTFFRGGFLSGGVLFALASLAYLSFALTAESYVTRYLPKESPRNPTY
jgi:hypothetical protein